MAGQDTALLFYDAECGFCRVAAGVALAWDRGRRLTPVPLQSATPQLADLSEQERMASWHLVEPDGSRHSGGSAFAPLFEGLPRGRRPARLARRFPGGAERLYGLTAEHRDRLAKLVPPRLRRSAEATLQRRAKERSEPFGEEPHPPVDSTSTSEPHPSQDPEAEDRWEGPTRDKLDR